MSKGRIQVSTRRVPSDIKDYSVVISMPVVVGVADRAKAFVEPGRTGNNRSRARILLADQVTRKSVDIYSVGHISDRVAVADDMVGMRSVITHTGGKILPQAPLQRHRPDVRRRRLQQRVNAADGEACSDNSSLRVKSASLLRRGARSWPESWEGKSKGRLAAVSENEDRSLRAGGAVGHEGRRNLSRGAAAKFFLHVGLREPVVIDAKPAAHHPVSLFRDIPGEADARTE